MGICDKIVFVAPMGRWLIQCKKAGVSESADEADSKSVDGNIVRVQVPPPAKSPNRFLGREAIRTFFLIPHSFPGPWFVERSVERSVEMIDPLQDLIDPDGDIPAPSPRQIDEIPQSEAEPQIELGTSVSNIRPELFLFFQIRFLSGID